MIIIIIIAVAFAARYYNNIRFFVARNIETDSKNMKKTIVTPTLNAAIVPGKNIIFCCTFQNAWNILRKEVVRDRPVLKDQPAYVNDLNDNFEKIFLAGPSDTVVSTTENSILIESKFERFIDFEEEFETVKNFKFYSSDQSYNRVKAFGIDCYYKNIGKHASLYEQFKIIECEPQAKTVVLTNAKCNDIIVLTTRKPEGTLIETFNSIQKTIKSGMTKTAQNSKFPESCYENISRLKSMMDQDELKIPVISFNVSHEFDELCDKNLENAGFKDHKLTRARQKTKFRLSEAGVELKSESMMYYTKGDGPEQYNFGSPFTLYLQERNTELPYFMMYIDNEELLETY